MASSPTRTRRRRGLAAAATAVVLVGIGGLTITALTDAGAPEPASPAAPPAPPAAPPPGTSPAGAAATTPPASTSAVALLPVAPSADPVEFAASAARALFEWDTTTTAAVADYKGRLLVVADPSGAESAALAVDLARYLPSPQAWAHLRQYDTRQWLEVTAAVIPDAWTDALAQTPDVVAPGTSAVTITGVRHRAGIWDGEPVTARLDVAFTAFVHCGQQQPTCSLLRLTQLDKPLR